MGNEKPVSGICTVHSGTCRTMESSRQAPKACVPRAGVFHTSLPTLLGDGRLHKEFMSSAEIY